MLNFIDRTLRELGEEIQYVTQHLRHWWGSMSDGEQLFFVGVLSAALLLLGMRRPGKSKTSNYNDGEAMSTVQQFMFAAVLLVIFTFGIDIAIESFA